MIASNLLAPRSIWRLDSVAAVEIADIDGPAAAMAADASSLYIGTEERLRAVRRSDGEVEFVVDDVTPSVLAVEADHVYWLHFHRVALNRVEKWAA